MLCKNIVQITQVKKSIMPEGTVQWFNFRKGYGFIATSDGKNVFVHYENISEKGNRALNVGDIVTFDVAKSEHGFRAENVILQPKP